MTTKKENKMESGEEKAAATPLPTSPPSPTSASSPTVTVEELTDLVKRTQANFENYRKQMQVQIEEIKKMAARDVINQLLPIVDNFDLALKTVNPEKVDKVDKEFIQGIELIHSQLLQLLQRNNVLAIETIGKKFDPYYHEALMKAPSELPADTIIEEFQKGFMMHGKVLRHAKVKISSGPTSDTNKKNSQTNN